ncbi:hypothetical protein SCOR_15195 [Sulfidibacter corallicola]|uniref:Uncharacterized protein n=1 Tax=Sulfidibacter corallicola TaxID=2818388 RepID=A0A8A4TW54_SULCO|nr:hypothetical protein [Sulfidibacter corallicola]QTD54186.1 hypothetical protein J3U87_17205 [Sulfidibacter corallicola]
MKTFKSTCSGILIVPEANLRLSPGESFICDQVSKEVAAAVAKGLLVAVEPNAGQADPETEPRPAKEIRELEPGLNAPRPRGRPRKVRTPEEQSGAAD